MVLTPIITASGYISHHHEICVFHICHSGLDPESSQLNRSLNMILSIDWILAFRQYDNPVCINWSGCNQDA